MPVQLHIQCLLFSKQRFCTPKSYGLFASSRAPSLRARALATMKREIELTEQESTLRQLLLDVSDFIGDNGIHERPVLRFTGGWVRDKLLCTTSKDIDIGISSTTGFQFATYMKRFLDQCPSSSGYGPDVIGSVAKIEANPEKSKHLETATTKILGLEIDLVNLRKETYVDDSRNPQMDFGSPEDDAFRRDATVNALFYNLSSAQVEDFTQRGLDDLEAGVIRTPLAAYQTFQDDPLRVLRCIRFASKLGFSIDSDAEHCMADTSIQESLRKKISRERVGVEVEKMLQGPRPQLSLSLIDRLGLYGTIFTNPKWPVDPDIELGRWHQSYEHLASILDANSEGSLLKIRTILNLSEADSHKGNIHRAWLLCALVPWARIQSTTELRSSPNDSLSEAAMVAREGLKVDNKTLNVIKGASTFVNEIIVSKNMLSSALRIAPPAKRKEHHMNREELGMAIRRWGPHWRSSVISAMCVESAELPDPGGLATLADGYASWLTELQKLDVLEAYALKPLVDGNKLMEAVGRPGGNWLASALNAILQWQLRNPGETNPDDAIADVVERFRN